MDLCLASSGFERTGTGLPKKEEEKNRPSLASETAAVYVEPPKRGKHSWSFLYLLLSRIGEGGKGREGVHVDLLEHCTFDALFLSFSPLPPPPFPPLQPCWLSKFATFAISFPLGAAAAAAVTPARAAEEEEAQNFGIAPLAPRCPLPLPAP